MSNILLPTGENIELSVLRDKFAWIDFIPPTFPTLAFKALVLKSFVATPVPDSDSEDSPLVTLLSLQDQNSEGQILVQKQFLPREIAAAHWLRLCATQANRQILMIDAVSEWFADSKVSFVAEGKSYFARFAVQIVGGDAILFFCFAPETSYNALADAFGAFIGTWKLTSPPKQPSVENWAEHGIAGFRFQIPNSWKKSPDSTKRKNLSSAVFANLDDDGELNGMIRVATEPDNVGNAILGGLEEAFEYWKLMGVTDFHLLSQQEPSLEAAWAKECSLKIFRLDGDSIGTFEGWLLAIDIGDRWLTVSMLTPPELDQAHFHAWAFNHRAFQIVAKTVASI